jgi:hypothetical protein
LVDGVVRTRDGHELSIRVKCRVLDVSCERGDCEVACLAIRPIRSETGEDRVGWDTELGECEPEAERHLLQARRRRLHRLAKRRWARIDLIVLDDFAMRDFTPAQADDL